MAEQSQATVLLWSAQEIASGNCVCDPPPIEYKTERPLQRNKLEATSEEREELAL